MFLSKKFDKLIDGLAKAVSFLYTRLDKGLYLTNLTRPVVERIEKDTSLTLAPIFTGAACPACNIKQYRDVQKMVRSVNEAYYVAFPNERPENPRIHAWEYKFPDPGKCDKCQGCKLCHDLGVLFPDADCQKLYKQVDDFEGTIRDFMKGKFPESEVEDGFEDFYEESFEYNCDCPACTPFEDEDEN